MNNLIKNVAIWLVIALVLMTVFNQFSSRQAAQSVIPYSQFMDEVKQGRVTSAQVEGRTVPQPVHLQFDRPRINLISDCCKLDAC